LLSVAGLLCLPAASPAQEAAEPEHVSFQDALQIALARNASLLRTENDLDLDRITVSGARMSFFPDLNLRASAAENFGRTFSEDEGRVLSTSNQSVSAGLSSSLLLFNGFGRIATLKAALASQEAGEQDTERARQTVAFLVISGYLAMIEGAAQVDVAQENFTAQEEQEVLVRRLVDGGRNPISDLYQQQASVARAKQLLVAARRGLDLTRIDMVQLLQLDPTREYVFDTPSLPDSIDPGPEPLVQDLMASAFEHRLDILAAEARVEASEQSVKVASSGHWPTLSLSGSYGSSYSSQSSGRSVAQQLDDRRGGSVGLGLSFPVFDRFETSRSVSRAKIGVENAEINLSDQRQTVALEVRRAVLDELSARETLAAARAQLRAASQALEAMQQRYEAGASTLYELTLTRADFTEAQSARITAAYTLVWQKYVREYYVGVLNPEAPLRSP
jgi:outer membrane protein